MSRMTSIISFYWWTLNCVGRLFTFCPSIDLTVGPWGLRRPLGYEKLLLGLKMDIPLLPLREVIAPCQGPLRISYY